MKLGKLFPRRLAHRLAVHVNGLSIGVRCLLTDNDRDTVLLVRHTYLPGWHFPGGGVHPGETVAEAAHRELVEEAGIELLQAPDLCGVYINRRLNRRDHVLLFRCGRWRAQREFRPNFEIAEMGFFDLNDLPADLSRGTARRLAEVFDGKPVSEEW